MGAGYVAGYCIAQLLNEGWRGRTTVRNLGAAEEVRATIGLGLRRECQREIEFMAADLKVRMLAGPMRSRGLTMCSMSRLSCPDCGPESLTMNWFDRRATGTLRVLKAARDARRGSG